jgi:hypothetical protein
MARFSAMVDMGKTADEVKEEIEERSGGPEASTAVYPYGLCVALTEEELEKLGIGDELPNRGDMIHIIAMAKVTAVSENENEMTDGSKKVRRRVELQITHIALEDEDDEGEEEARRSRFYGSSDTKAA